MKKNSKYKAYIVMPVLASLGALIFKSFWLVVATVIMIFTMVAVLPFCHKRENLWLFILCAVCAVPINIFLLKEYPQWTFFVYSGSGKGILYYMAFVEAILIATGVEEVIISVIGRKIWRKQFSLTLPEHKDSRM